MPFAQSQSYAKKLKEAGVEVTLLEVKDEDHCFVGDPENQALKAMFEFLDKPLKPTETTVPAPAMK